MNGHCLPASWPSFCTPANGHVPALRPKRIGMFLSPFFASDPLGLSRSTAGS